MSSEEITRKVKDPQGRIVDGVVVDVSDAIEPFGELTLADGTIIKTRSTVVEVVRIDSQRDVNGNPLYIINSAQIVSVVKGPDE